MGINPTLWAKKHGVSMQMIRFSFISLLTFLMSSSLWAAAQCSLGDASVSVKDNASIGIEGLDGFGIKSGNYQCKVYSVSQTWIGSESRAVCIDKDQNSVRIWQSEMIGWWGIRSATVAIYDGQGSQKFFEAPCVRE